MTAVGEAPSASGPALATTSPAVPATVVPAETTSTAQAASPVAAATGDAACAPAHEATVEESIDLSPTGQSLAPSLKSFNLYRFDLSVDTERTLLMGTETLQFTNRTDAPLSDLLFHLYPNLPDFGGRLEVTCVAVDDLSVVPRLEDDDWLLRVPLTASLAPGATARVTLRFETSSLQRRLTGAYGAFNADDDLWTLASFYPILAIRVGDTWDTARPNGWGDFVNSDAALYHAQVSLPESYDLLATGAVTRSCEAAHCTATVTAGPHRDFTLSLTRGWRQERATVGDTIVVSSFPAEWEAPGRRVVDLAADSLTRFNEAFGPYPYTELDLLPVPMEGASGIEYPGLLMLDRDFYADMENRATFLEVVVVHEVAHMWWYNVVGNDVRREPWLDEGLTSYSGEYLYTEWTGQAIQSFTESRRDQLEQAGLDETPIGGAVTSYEEEQAYVLVIYGRAPLFFDSLRAEIGDESFFTLLREHYRRNAFRRATTAGFISLAEEVAGRELDAFLADWFAPLPGE